MVEGGLVPGLVRICAIGTGLGQGGDEPRPGPGESRAHCADGDLEYVGDLGIVEPHMLAQHDAHSEFLGQAGDGVVEHQPVGEPLGEQGSGAGQLPFGPALMFVDHRRCWAAPAAAKLVETGIGRNPIGPGAETGRAGEFRQAFADGNQRFLGCVSSIGIVASESSADAPDAVVVTTQQRVQRAVITALRGGDKSFVVEFGADAMSVAKRSSTIRAGQGPITLI